MKTSVRLFKSATFTTDLSKKISWKLLSNSSEKYCEKINIILTLKILIRNIHINNFNFNMFAVRLKFINKHI